jgi:hypothetical protein
MVIHALREASQEVTEKSFMDVVVDSGEEEVVVVAVEGLRKVDLIGLASENLTVIVAVTELDSNPLRNEKVVALITGEQLLMLWRNKSSWQPKKLLSRLLKLKLQPTLVRSKLPKK